MRVPSLRILISMAALAVSAAGVGEAADRWTPERAAEWAKRLPWLVGCNFAPSTAINQLEMWQAESFDLPTIERELDWAKSLGFTSLRVFLHDIPWKQDSKGYLDRIDTFLAAADRRGIGILFVFFDACWDPFPKAGKQRAPKPHVHNSGWVQSPGIEILKDRARHDEFEPYVRGVVRRFASDGRVQVWDLFNEPDNTNRSSYFEHEPEDKAALSLSLLEKAFAWVRAENPTQPLTAGLWIGDWSTLESMNPVHRFMAESSDVISFHNYGSPDEMKTRVRELEALGRPLLCTEYMARPARSTFDPVLEFLASKKIGAYNWGFVSGKTQTIYPWDSWQKTYTAEPPLWFHDIFRADGSAYIPMEVEYIRRVTRATK